MFTRALVVLAVLSLPLAAVAQDTPFTGESRSRPLIQPDGTYIFWSPNSNLVFEGQIAPRIIVFDTIGDISFDLLSKRSKPLWGWQASTTPMVRLRMFSETSSPVRTPSYMPKGTVQLVRMKNLSTVDPNKDEAAFDRGPVEMWLIDTIPFGHHSNGQNGCLFTSQVRSGEDCVDRVPAVAKTVNKTDGSFSTNYVQATVHYGRMYLDSKGAPEGEFATRSEWRIGGGVQLNPSGMGGGAIDDELRDLYGPTRVIVDAMSARRGAGFWGRLEGNVNLQYIVDKPSGIPRLITRAEFSFLPKKWGGAGGFVRFYHGQDYYNLGFAEGITKIQFGFALQRATFLSFHP